MKLAERGIFSVCRHDVAKIKMLVHFIRVLSTRYFALFSFELSQSVTFWRALVESDLVHAEVWGETILLRHEEELLNYS